MKVEGRIFSGMGVGKEYISLEPYQEEIKSITGFRPYPGTLNIRGDEKDIHRFLDNLEASRIQKFKYKGDTYSGVDVYTVEIEGLSAAVLRMDVTDYGPEVLEIVAENNLREELGLEDGDKAEIVFR